MKSTGLPNMKTFTLYADPGHAWLKVPVAILTELKIADRITRFSYRRGAYVVVKK